MCLSSFLSPHSFLSSSPSQLTNAAVLKLIHHLLHLMPPASRHTQRSLVRAQPLAARTKLALGARAELQLVQLGASSILFPFRLQQPRLQLLKQGTRDTESGVRTLSENESQQGWRLEARSNLCIHAM